jgi:hypothetical protein
MANQDIARLANAVRKESPLPRAPSTDPLSKDQWKAMYAFADTIVASIQPARHDKQNLDLGIPENDYAVAVTKIEHYALASGNTSLVEDYLMEKPSQVPLFRENIYRLLSCYVPKDLYDQLTLGLTLLK